MMKYAVAAVAAAASLMLAGTAMAQSVTYYVYSAPYTGVSNATCPVGNCSAIYTRQQKLNGTITFYDTLDPNLNVQTDDVGYMIEDFTLTDGHNTYTLLAPDPRFLMPNMVVNFARVSTDAGGVITAFEFRFDRSNGSPFSVSSVPSADIKTRVASIYFSSVNSMVTAENNARCTLRGAISPMTFAPPGSACKNIVAIPAEGAASASSGSITMSLTPPPPPPPVPTLSEWAMILFGVLLAGGAALSLQRRRQTA